MRFWWLAVILWLFALCTWFQELTVLVLSRLETDYSDSKLLLLISIWIIIVFSFFHAPPAAIPQRFACSPEESKQIAEEMAISDVRYCNSCGILKPERAHHCRICQRCVLRMDHHCPILQICIHHGNQKFYILYLIWPCLLGIYAIYLCWQSFYRILPSIFSANFPTEDQLIFSAVINAVAIVGSVLYLLSMQLPNAVANRTIIEESKDTNIYVNEDWKENVTSIMGNEWSWLLPVDTIPGNGFEF